MSNSSIWPPDRTLSGATTPGLSRPWEQRRWRGTLHSLNHKTWAASSDGLVSYPKHSLRQGLTPLQRCSWRILQGCERIKCLLWNYQKVIKYGWIEEGSRFNIYHHHHHHHYFAPPVRISLSLYRHHFLSSITSGMSSGLHPVSAQSCCM